MQCIDSLRNEGHGKGHQSLPYATNQVKKIASSRTTC
jgi:hypothetical protein